MENHTAKLCAGPGRDGQPCGRSARPSRNYCSGHAEQVRLGKEMRPILTPPSTRQTSEPCSQSGCDRPKYGRGICGLHYQRARANGTIAQFANEKRADLSIAAPERFASIGWNETDNGCWTWKGTLEQNGYGSFRVSTGNSVGAHRYAVYLATGQMPGSSQHVAHACDNPPCVNPAHLSAGTPKANMEDMAAKGRSTYGEKNTQAKLTFDQVVQIKARSKQGESSRRIAKDYPVHDSHIRAIVRGHGWQTALRIAGEI